jgi:hypothetical protein
MGGGHSYGKRIRVHFRPAAPGSAIGPAAREDSVFRSVVALCVVLLPLAWASTAFGDQVAEVTPAEIRLVPRTVENGPAAVGARVALLLIDCSSSMKAGVRGPGFPINAANPERWGLVRKAMRSSLEELQRASPGIEVRLEFFAGKYRCSPPVTDRLDGPLAVERVMKSVPETPPDKGSTVLYESVWKVLDGLCKEDEVRDFEWALFVVYSDGADRTSDAQYQKNGKNGFNVAVDRFRQKVRGAEALALIVGAEAEQFLAEGGFGPLAGASIGTKIPLPPKPQPVFDLRLSKPVPDQPPAKPGSYRIPIRFDAPAGAFPTSVSFSIPGRGPFRLKTPTATVSRDGRTECEVQLDPNENLDAGVSVTVRVEPGNEPAQAARFAGTAEFTVRFAGTGALPPERWRVSTPAHVRVDQGFSVSIDPGNARQPPRWTFTGPAGKRVEREGFSTEARLDAGGTWTATASVVSPSGNKADSRPATIEVVDCGFELRAKGQPAARQIQVLRGARSLELELVPSGASPAEYVLLFDGQPEAGGLTLGPPSGSTRAITIGGGLLGNVGIHTLTVSATSRTGGYRWTQSVPIEVAIAPDIAILGATYVEGMPEAEVALLVSGDVGGKVSIEMGTFAGTEAVQFGKDELPMRQVVVKVPKSHVNAANMSITVRPGDRNACPEARGSLVSRAAELGCRMVRPTDGATIEPERPGELVVSPSGEDVDLFGDSLEFEIAFRDGLDPGERATEPKAGEIILRAKAPDWKVAIPAGLNPPKVVVFARPSSNRLNPALFPDTGRWREIGTLAVVKPKVALRAVGEVVPGASAVFQLEGVNPANIDSVRWTFGPLPGDPEMAGRPLVRDSALASQDVVPKAWGTMPVSAVVKLRNGVLLEEARVDAAVQGKSPVCRPSLESTEIPYGSDSIVLNPGVSGSFRSFKVAVLAADSRSDAPLWNQSYTTELKQITIPLAGLPDRFVVVVEATPFPGDPAPPAPARISAGITLPTPIIRLATGKETIQPGQPASLRVEVPPPAEVADVAWSVGPLANDSRLGSTAVRLDGLTPQLTVDAIGSLPVRATVTLKGGVTLEEVSTAVAVVADPPKINPTLARKSIVKGQPSVALSPGVEGDFRGYTVQLHRRGDPEDATPIWTSQRYTSNQDSIDVPLVGEEVRDLPDEFEVVVVVEPYSTATEANPPPIRSGPQAGTLVPPPEWHWWILCLLGFLAAGWQIGKFLFGNDPIRWILEFLPRDPGSPIQEHGDPMASFGINERRADPRSNHRYTGWSRRRKEAIVPLWLLADVDGQPDTEWLATDAVRNITIRVNRGGIDLKSLPQPGQASGWADPESPYIGHDAADGEKFKSTYRLQHSGGREKHNLYLRLRCPRGRDPLEWIFWTYSVAALIATVILASVFHII